MTSIPKHYYTYWHSLTPPDLVQLCFDRFEELNPGWTGHILNERDLAKIPHPKNFDKINTPAHRADWVRCYTLAKHGGVWLDSSIIMLKPLESWVDMDFNGLQGFWIGDAFENWAFAVPQNCPFMSAWRDEFQNAIEVGFDTYATMPRVQPLAKLQKGLPYLTMHLCWRVVRAKMPDYPLKATQSTDGPFVVQKSTHFLTLFTVLKLSFFPKSKLNLSSDVTFLKLRGSERRGLQRMLDLKLYSPNSILVTDLTVPSPAIHPAFYLCICGCFLVVLIILCLSLRFFINKR